MEARRKSCPLDTHPLAEEISGWLRQGMTATAINANLKKLDLDAKEYAPVIFSRHRIDCLGLVKLSKGRNPASTVTPDEVDDSEEVTGDMVRDLSLKTFYTRLKKDPKNVGMKELTSVISALSRAGAGGKTGKSALDQAMSNLDD